MTLRCTSNSFHTFLLWFCVLALTSSCEIKYSSEIINADEEKKSIAEASQIICECYSKQKGDIDTRLTPCINKVSHSQTATLPEGHSPQDSARIVNAMNSKIADDMSNTMQKMIVSCDAFGSEVEMMYDKWYPVDSSAAQLDSIKILENKFQTLSTSDTSRKTVLNKLIAKNIEARRLGEGLRRCQQMKKLFKDEGGAYYASAFVYNLQKKYPLAINELEQEVSLEKNNDLKLFIALMRRKAQRNL
jgi:hypothetical protein